MTASELKKSILQMAVEGKLTEQSKKDEPVEKLLKRIKEEKEKLIKEGKIKKENTISEIYKKDGSYYERIAEGKNILKEVCIDEELPFEIPDSWAWCHIDDIFIIEMGQSPKGDTVYTEDKGIEFHQGKVSFGDKYILKSNQTTSSPTKIAPKNSLLLCVRAPVGKVNITKREICIGRGLCYIQTLSGMSVDFIYYLFETYEDIFIKKATGTTFVAITSEVIKKQFVPLPPIEEQKRIVEKINQLMPLINEYDSLEKNITKLNKEFPNSIKKSILQYAIEGKLTEQSEKDEPVEKLLKRIKEEREKLIKEGKIKKEKTISEIYKKDGSYYERITDGKNILKDVCIDDELPFEIPDSWAWVKINSISKSITAGGDKPNNYSEFKTEKFNIPILSNGKENDGVFGYTDIPKIIEPSITISGRGTIGFSCVRRYPYFPIVRLISIIPFNIINLDFVKIVFDVLIEKGVGTSVKQLTVPMLIDKLIPLPPIEEQKRIADKINRLNEIINTIKL